mmetsp:Transcript_1784/g.3780  ORF Transcript_1784/g.3780 Transcript_1784/m.3780 type:complete len:281 (-) Transcript_1784:64-906(-)
MSDTQIAQARPGWELGTVKWFNPDKGFGFVVPDGGSGAASEDVFVHFSVVKGQGFKSLGDGEQVEFKAQMGNDGRRRATECTGVGGGNVKGSERKSALAAKGGKGGKGGKGDGKGMGGMFPGAQGPMGVMPRMPMMMMPQMMGGMMRPPNIPGMMPGMMMGKGMGAPGGLPGAARPPMPGAAGARPQGAPAGQPGMGQSFNPAGPLTVASLAAAPPGMQKQMLGEKLFPLIAKLQPELAGKITGMMLEMDNQELLILLESDDQLKLKVDEALRVLGAQQG